MSPQLGPAKAGGLDPCAGEISRKDPASLLADFAGAVQVSLGKGEFQLPGGMGHSRVVVSVASFTGFTGFTDFTDFTGFTGFTG